MDDAFFCINKFPMIYNHKGKNRAVYIGSDCIKFGGGDDLGIKHDINSKDHFSNFPYCLFFISKKIFFLQIFKFFSFFVNF